MSYFKNKNRMLSNIFPKNIFARFILILVFPVILSQFVMGIIFAEKYTHVILRIISRQVAGEVVAMTNLLDIHCNKETINILKSNMNINIETLTRSSLQKIGIAKNHKAYRTLRNAFADLGYKKIYIDTRFNRMNVYIQSKDNKSVYRVSFTRKTLYMKILPLVLGSGFLASIIFLATAFIFLKNQIKPIKRLAIEAINFGKGIENPNYRPEGASEIRIAGIAFCEMKHNINELVNKRMRILAGIAHDLKTPLTKMKLQLSIMQKNKDVEWLIKDVNLMIKITESFTSHAYEQNNEKFTYRNIAQLLEEIASEFKDTSFVIHISGDMNIHLMVKYISLRRAFTNIVSNAKKYSKNIYININTFHDKNNVIITFDDDGNGVENSNLESIFIPYFQCKNENNDCSTSQGVGLGLSIVRDIIALHRGNISACKSSKYGGACFTITFPR